MFVTFQTWYVTLYSTKPHVKSMQAHTLPSSRCCSAQLISLVKKQKSLSSAALLFSGFVTRRARLSLPFSHTCWFFVPLSKRNSTKDLLSTMLLTAFHIQKDNAKKGGWGTVKPLKTPKLTAQQYDNFSVFVLSYYSSLLRLFFRPRQIRTYSLSIHSYADQRIHIQIRALDRIQRQKQYKPPRLLLFFHCWLLWHVHFIFL